MFCGFVGLTVCALRLLLLGFVFLGFVGLRVGGCMSCVFEGLWKCVCIFDEHFRKQLILNGWFDLCAVPLMVC